MMNEAEKIFALRQLEFEGHPEAHGYVHESGVARFVDEREMLADRTLAAARHRASAVREKQARLEAIPSELLALFSTLSEDTQAKWYDAGKVAAVRGALEHGNPGVARRLIASAAVLPRSEEDAVKKRMLALFDFPRGT